MPTGVVILIILAVIIIMRIWRKDESGISDIKQSDTTNFTHLGSMKYEVKIKDGNIMYKPLRDE